MVDAYLSIGRTADQDREAKTFNLITGMVSKSESSESLSKKIYKKPLALDNVDSNIGKSPRHQKKKSLLPSNRDRKRLGFYSVPEGL